MEKKIHRLKNLPNLSKGKNKRNIEYKREFSAFYILGYKTRFWINVPILKMKNPIVSMV